MRALCGGLQAETLWRTVAGAGSMLKIQTWLLLLALCAGNLEAWFWSTKEEPTTQTPTVNGTADASTPTGATTPTWTTGAPETANATKKKDDPEEDDDLSGVGEEILNVATGIRKFVQAWDATPTARTTNGGLTEKAESANPNTTGNPNRFSKGRVEEGSGVGVGNVSESDVESGVKASPRNVTEIVGDVSKINETVEGILDLPPTPSDSRINGSDPSCLPVPSDWSICSGKHPKSFTLPNFFNHTSVEEVGAVLQEWAWLTREGCHHSAEWFLCLLLAPRCPPTATAGAPLHLPCRSFCQVLQDSCWASLENGRLPVECHLLPDGEQELGRPACVSVSNCKGNPGGLECILTGDTF